MSDNNFEVTNPQVMFDMFCDRFNMTADEAVAEMETNGFSTEGVVTGVDVVTDTNQVGCESKDFFSGWVVS